MSDNKFTPVQSAALVSPERNGTKDTVETNEYLKTADDLLNRPKVLMYHRIVDDESLSQRQETCVHISKFCKQLELIDRLGYTPITFNDYRLYQSGEIQLPKKPIILTFDDGYLDTYRLAFPLLKEYGMKAVIFVLGDQSIQTNAWDADQPGISAAPLMDKDHIIDLCNNGFEIGGHTLNHSNLANLSKADCLHEAQKTKIVLEAITGSEVYSFSYPYGQVSQQVKDCVAESGYRYACSVFSGPARFGSDLLEIRRITIRNNTSIPGFALRLVSPYEYLEWMWWKSHSNGVISKRNKTRINDFYLF